MINTSTRQSAKESVPVIALSSSLSTRTNTSVPPASAVYDPLVKTILARRFVYNVLLVSGIASWVLAALWTSWQLGGVDSLGILGGVVNWLSPLTLFCTMLWWMLASVPIAVLRKMYLQATYCPSLSPRQTLFQHIKERQYQIALVVALISSACMAVCQVTMAQTVEKGGRKDPKMGIWAGSRKHPYHLNGRLCFLFVSQMTCASIYWLRDVLKSRFSIRWSNQSSLFVHAFPLLSSSLISMVMLSTASTISSLLIFIILRSIALPFSYRLPIVHSLIRPFVAHFLRPTFTISFLWSHYDILIRAFLLALSTQVLWEIPSAMFDAVFSLPAATTEACKDSSLILVSGINSANAYLQLHAFHELSLLSSDVQMTSRRAVIYGDTKYNPTLWVTLVRRSLLLLGTDYQLFLRRGNPAPPPAPETAAVEPLTSSEKPATSVIRTQVYKTPNVTTIDRIADTLSSDSPIPGALAQSGVSNELSRFVGRALRPRVHMAQVGIKLPNMSHVVTSATSFIPRLVPSSWRRALDISIWWGRERKDREAQKALPNKELDVLIVEVLSKMVAHSLTEDGLGFVQRDIPRVLEALVSFLSAIEDYQKELSSFASAKESCNAADQDRILILKEEIVLASAWVEELSEGLRTGLSLIVRTFGDRLTKYRFPSKIALKLQVFADYSA